MTPEMAAGLRDVYLQTLRSEVPTTARVLAAVPDDKASYAPHETSMNAQDLAAHVAIVDMWFLESIAAGSFDRPENPGGETPKPSQAATMYQNAMPGLMDKVAALSPEHLANPVKFYHLTLPNVLYLDFCIRHCVHHRGQLSAYLRPMGAKVPSIYGGSADEPFDVAAAAMQA